jgi:hypothetical protein
MMSADQLSKPFASINGITLAVTLLFAAMAVCHTVFILFSVGELVVPREMEFDEGPIAVFVVLIGLLALLHLPVWLGGIVVFLVWIYKAYKNLEPLQASGLSHSPGWAVGWWFIPFANLVKPYQVMKEIWVESDPEYESELAFLPTTLSAPAIMGLWWATFLAGNILGRIAERMVPIDGAVPSTYFYFFIISNALHLISLAAVVVIIRDISDRQEKRHLRLGIRPSDVPPPPRF